MKKTEQVVTLEDCAAEVASLTEMAHSEIESVADGSVDAQDVQSAVACAQINLVAALNLLTRLRTKVDELNGPAEKHIQTLQLELTRRLAEEATYFEGALT